MVDATDPTTKSIPGPAIYYAQMALQHQVCAIVARCFARKAKEGLTVEELGKRIGMEPTKVETLLDGTYEWTLDDVSDLLLGMGFEPDMRVMQYE